MPTPDFTIAIPTCDRHFTVGHTIRSVLNSHYGNFEIVVSDNFSSPETYEVIKSIADPRIKYVRTRSRISMCDNWENALNHASGRYIFFLGDDDALLPDAMPLAMNLFQKFGFPAISWRRCNVYWWPDCISAGRRNYLTALLPPPGPVFQVHESRAVIQTLFNFSNWTVYEILPMVYNSFVARDVIDRVRARNGTYFGTLIADFWSGIQNAWQMEKYCFSSRPFSIAGICGSSNGWSFSVDPESELSKKFLKESGFESGSFIHPSLPQYNCNELLVGSLLLHFKESLGAAGEGFQLNYFNLTKSLLDLLRTRSDQYDEFRRVVEQLCRDHNINLASHGLGIPEKPMHMPSLNDAQLAPGPRYHGTNLVGMNLFCPTLGIYDVAGAAKLMYSLLPPTPVL